MSVHPLPSNLRYIPMSWFSWVHQAVMVHYCDGVLVRRDKTNESHRECAFLKKKIWIINRVNNVSEPSLQIYKLTMFQSDQCWNFCCFIAYQDEVDIKSHSTEEVESSSSKDKGFSDEMHFTSSHHSLLSSKLLLFYWITFQFTINFVLKLAAESV